MALLQRQRVTWTGFPGAPGLSTFYFVDAAASQARLRTFLVGCASAMPPDVTMTLQPGGDVINDLDGALSASWAGTVQAPIPGTGAAGSYAAPVGWLVRWETLRIVAGSRLRGRTYFVPASGGVYEADGTLAAGTITSQNTNTFAFVGDVTPNMLVWQRPRAARVAYTDGRGIPHKAVPGRQGSSAVVVAHSIPDLAVVLRSRRD